MADTHVLLAKSTVGAAGASSIDFTNIPQTGYTDLKLIVSAREATTTSLTLYLTINNSSSSIYSTKIIQADGASAISAATTNTTSGNFAVIDSSGYTANTFNNAEIYIPNYTSSNNKSVSVDSVTENNATTAYSRLTAGIWASTNAINQLTLSVSGGNLAANSTAYLYGISNVNTTPTVAPKASGGNIITNDGTYWIHTFLSSGTFTPQTALSCDYLVVAGGGSSGYRSDACYYMGGGGGGGLRSTVGVTGGGGSLESKLSTAANTAYTVTVGAGAPAPSAINQAGIKGSDSSFSTITSTGGGAGGLYDNNGGAGGSGGGAGGNDLASTGGAGTTSQGYAGGNKVGTTYSATGAGGGGAGGVGGNGGNSSGAGGTGGACVQISISGTATYYAGGGAGGGAYPSAVLGADPTGYNNIANRGMGGHIASNGGSTTAAGGSGIVIVRYAM